ncbi:hypothetical protein D3C71_1901440 [compost metagenome]
MRAFKGRGRRSAIGPLFVDQPLKSVEKRPILIDFERVSDNVTDSVVVASQRGAHVLERKHSGMIDRTAPEDILQQKRVRILLVDRINLDPIDQQERGLDERDFLGRLPF